MPGLLNLGNTCYINSVIQCIKSDINFVKNILEIKDNEDTHVIIKNTRALLGALHGKYKVIKPTSFKRSIDYYLPKYDNKNQHDAHELFTDFIDLIDKITLKIDPPQENSVNPLFNSKNNLYERWLKEIYMGKTSIIIDNYHGSLLLKYTCRSCGSYFYKFEEFTSIILHCRKNTNISDLINSYFEEDYVNVKCKECCNELSEGVEHEITKTFYKLPDTLCFVINKFKLDNKNDCNVEIDKRIDLCELFLSQDTSVYDFHSAVIHEGSSVNSGHYYSIIDDVIYDDEQVFNYTGNYSDLNCYMSFYKKYKI